MTLVIDRRTSRSPSFRPRRQGCPARSHAYLIAQAATSRLLDALPETDPAVPTLELAWRHSP